MFIFNCSSVRTIDLSEAVEEEVCSKKQQREFKTRQIETKRKSQIFSNVCVTTCGHSCQVWCEFTISWVLIKPENSLENYAFGKDTRLGLFGVDWFL